MTYLYIIIVATACILCFILGIVTGWVRWGHKNPDPPGEEFMYYEHNHKEIKS